MTSNATHHSRILSHNLYTPSPSTGLSLLENCAQPMQCLMSQLTAETKLSYRKAPIRCSVLMKTVNARVGSKLRRRRDGETSRRRKVWTAGVNIPDSRWAPTRQYEKSKGCFEKSGGKTLEKTASKVKDTPKSQKVPKRPKDTVCFY